MRRGHVFFGALVVFMRLVVEIIDKAPPRFWFLAQERLFVASLSALIVFVRSGSLYLVELNSRLARPLSVSKYRIRFAIP